MLSPGEPLVFYTGALLCAVVSLGALSGGLGWARGRSQQRRRADEDAITFREEVRVAAAAARARLAQQLAWEGLRPLRVGAIVEESPDTKSFYLTSLNEAPLPRFLPGQYLTLTLPVQTVANGPPTIRCYSLSDRPHREYYRLTVKRQLAPSDSTGVPPGIGSGWLHDRVQVGDELQCEAPRGAFFHEPTYERPTVFIGAGVGVTPIMSMLSAIVHSGILAPTMALLSFRDGEHHLYRDALNDMARHPNPHLKLQIAYTRPGQGDAEGIDYHHRGRISIDRLRNELPSNNFDFYLCGPPQMMQTLVPELLEWGVPPGAIHYEAFGPASVSTPGSESLAERAIGSLVQFNPDAEAIVWDGSHATLLEMAEAHGAPIPSGCRAGNCGACCVRIARGTVSTLRRPGTTVAKGECLACISVPDGSVTLETQSATANITDE